MNLKTLLYSDFQFDESEDMFKFHIKFLNSIFIIGIVTTLLFAFMSLTGLNPYDPVDIAANFFYALSTFSLFLLLRRSKENFSLVANLFLINTMLISTIAIFVIVEDSFRAIWFYLAIYLAFIFNGVRSGWFYTLLSISIILIYEATTLSPDGYITINTMILGMIVMSFLFHINTQKFNEQTKALEEKTEILTHLASTDTLTSIANRYYFDEQALRYFEESKKASKDLALILLDIDHFKQINDTFGHPAGDQILIRFAQIIKEFSNEEMIFARIGGEEFALLQKEMDLERAKVFSQKLCDTIASNTFYFEEIPIQVTVSIGIALYDQKDLSFSKLFIRADDALYRAKEGGRNRIAF